MNTRIIALFIIISLTASLLSACSSGTVTTASTNSGLSAATRLAV
jgi:hypothetical protein